MAIEDWLYPVIEMKDPAVIEQFLNDLEEHDKRCLQETPKPLPPEPSPEELTEFMDKVIAYYSSGAKKEGGGD